MLLDPPPIGRAPEGSVGEIITRAYKLTAGVPVTEATADESQYTDVVSAEEGETYY